MRRGPLRPGETVQLTDDKGRHYSFVLAPGGEFHTHRGGIAHDALIDGPEGVVVRSTTGTPYLALRPLLADFTLGMPRGAAVVYPKDAAQVVHFGDVFPGATVLEAGAGSGALTLALLAAVGPTGRVISFERRDDHARIARRNVVRFLGEEPGNWELREGDVVEGLAGVRAHRVVLDLLEPWAVVDAAADTLPPGGIVLSYTPTVPQVMRTTEALWADGRFADVRTTETLVRGWDVDGLAVRPKHRMVAHTAFLTTARRVPARDEGGPPPPRRKSDLATAGVVWTDSAVADGPDAAPSDTDAVEHHDGRD